jgi:hypothetical protein
VSIECISWLIKVTNNNDARWILEIKAHLCRACLWTCLCLLYNSHFTFPRRSKESQSVKEAFLPSSQNYSHIRFLSNVANPGVA